MPIIRRAFDHETESPAAIGAMTDAWGGCTVPGIEGYASDAVNLIARYDKVPFVDKHRAVLHLLPAAPSRVLDIGAGTGADAAWLAWQGHSVLAVEPTDALRHAAIARHASPRIEWLADSLPMLARIAANAAHAASFDLILITAVWMHLSPEERAAAMPRVAALLHAGGLLTMTLRHGPGPVGRRVFDVSAEETVALAEHAELRLALSEKTESVQPANRAAGVTWTRLAFRR